MAAVTTVVNAISQPRRRRNASRLRNGGCLGSSDKLARSTLGGFCKAVAYLARRLIDDWRERVERSRRVEGGEGGGRPARLGLDTREIEAMAPVRRFTS